MSLAVLVAVLVSLAPVGACPRGSGFCMAPEPYLVFSHGQAIFQMSADGTSRTRIVARAGSSVLLDFHHAEGRIYWLDTVSGLIQRALFNGTQRQKVHLPGKGVTGFAVDWVQDQLFWTNVEKGTIERIGSNGKDPMTVLTNLSRPSSIAVDPNARLIFWVSDGVTPSIQKSSLDGESTTTALKTSDRLQALSLDFSDKRLFWVQFSSDGRGAIGSCDYYGDVINVMKCPLHSRPSWLSVFLEHAYYTDATARTITRVDKYSGDQALNLTRKYVAHPPISVRVVHSLQQPVAEAPPPALEGGGCDILAGDCVSVCSAHTKTGTCRCTDGFALSKHGNYCEDVNECALWDHGCTLGCENVPGSYFCTCPHSFILLPDMKTCHEPIPCAENVTHCSHGCVRTEEGDTCVCPEGSILQPDGKSCTGCSLPDNGGCSQVCMPHRPGAWDCECRPGYRLHSNGKRCTAIGPPPYLLFANFIDIRRINLDDTGEESLLEEPRGTLIALDYDPVQSKVYFASTALRRIERANLDGSRREVLVSEGVDSPEGLAVDWINRRLYWTDRGLSTIERSDLNGLNREVVIGHGIQKPRGIVIHPESKKLFWTDMGESPLVGSASLDGTERAVVADTDLASPSGLAVDHVEGLLYWCDGKRGVIEEAGLDGSGRRVLTENQVGHPFDVAVFEDLVWVTDWDQYLVLRVDKRTGRNLQRLHGNMVRPASLVVVHPLAKPGANPCLHENGGCDQICQSRFGLAHCSCHSHFAESSNDGTCLPVNATVETPESGDEESSDPTALKNQTLNDEGVPATVSGALSPAEEQQEETEPTLVTEKMVSDQDDCSSPQCGLNAGCLLGEGGSACQCQEGFVGDGEHCVDIDECVRDLVLCGSHSDCINTEGSYICRCRAGFSGDGLNCTDVDECELGTHDCDGNAECSNTVGRYLCRCPAGYSGQGLACQGSSAPVSPATTSRPLDVTTRWQNNNVVQSCPASHDTYCLYDGVCFYIPEMDSYACNCVLGYMGERCQFSDLEWWELQQAQEEKRRNLTIAVCMVAFIGLLSVAACVTYCYGSKGLNQKRPPADDVSETSSSVTETTAASTTRFFVVLEHAAAGDANAFHVLGCQRGLPFPSSSSETGESVVSEEMGSPSWDERSSEKPVGLTPTEAYGTGVHLKSIDNLIFLDDPLPALPPPAFRKPPRQDANPRTSSVTG